MPDPKMVSEREAVERVRSAVRHALYHGAGWGAAVADAYVNREHPRPKVERPRVVKDSADCQWKIECGTLWFRLGDGCDWRPQLDIGTLNRVGILADLFANPTESVDEDA